VVAAVSSGGFCGHESAGGVGWTPRLVLVALGDPADPAAPALLLSRVAGRLSDLTGVPLRAIAQPDPPAPALAALLAEPGPWLAPLSIDPGLALAAGTWAEALGAWRQPTLLVVDQATLATGIPAAATALLERWSVPLLGLLQWGGSWDATLRRRDGLPWLGCLAPDEITDRDADLTTLLRLRWVRCLSQLD